MNRDTYCRGLVDDYPLLEVKSEICQSNTPQMQPHIYRSTKYRKKMQVQNCNGNMFIYSMSC
jgi:hypothetical protein